MGIMHAIILGVVQGITEFLPVSSSGHLVLLQRLLGIQGPTLFFDTFLHGGTLIAVFIALRRDIWRLLRRPIQRMTGFLIIATAVTAAFAFGLSDFIEEAFESGSALGPAFLVTSAALFLSEFLSRRHGDARNDAEMGWFDAIVIGACQGIAVIPGVSRSGMTLSGALGRKLERDLAARFSFLLSIPAILGALVLQIKDMAEISGFEKVNPAAADSLTGGLGFAALAAGTLSAALIGFLSISLMLRIVKERSLTGFAVYTGLLGILIILDRSFIHLVF